MRAKQVLSYEVLGVPISATSLDHASRLIDDWSHDHLPRFVFIRDVHGIMQAYDNPELLELHRRAALVTPDGVPLVWLGRAAGLPVSRTCGPDLIERVMRDSANSGVKHYFYGGKEGVADALRAHFTGIFPGLQVVGTGSPPFRAHTEDELRDVASLIASSGADVVWIGISTPKQEYLMRDLAPRLTATLVGVGAAFDFHTGAVKRAPRWMRPIGLEWLWRLLSEPKRLWKRYLVMAPRFIWLVATRAWFRPHRRPETPIE